jgi:hypothetical protein
MAYCDNLFVVNGCRFIRHEYEYEYQCERAISTKVRESRDVMCTTPLKRDYWEDTCVQHYYTINIGVLMRKDGMRRDEVSRGSGNGDLSSLLISSSEGSMSIGTYLTPAWSRYWAGT